MTPVRRNFWATGAGAAIGTLLWVSATCAGSLEVGPTRVTLLADHPVGSVMVHNGGNDDMVVQLEPMAWTQSDGEDVYTPTSALITTPLVFKLSPDGNQVVRIGLRDGVPLSGEQDFRLYVREVPPDVQLGNGGLHIALRVGIPIFTRAASTTPAALSWQAHIADDGSLVIEAHNNGGQFVRVLAIDAWGSDTAKPVWQAAHFGYVLPASTYAWHGAVPASVTKGSTLKLTIKTEEGELSTALLVAA